MIYTFTSLVNNKFIDKKKFFTIQNLNVAIQNFNYSPEELNDRPQIIEKKSLRYQTCVTNDSS
jgi:uncharacterized membrane protein YjjP (DUF1212 family)